MSKKADPFMITEDDINRIESKVIKGTSGILCPKLNKDMEGVCHVCEYISTEIYANFPGKPYENHPARKWAGKKKGKLNWFLNVVFPDDKTKSVIFKIGEKAGNQIKDGMRNKGWTDICHPHAGMGRMMMCTKTKVDGYPTYSMSPELEKADWEVSEEVWKNVVDLRNIIEMLKDDDLIGSDNYVDISKYMKEGETITFRIMPPVSFEVGDRDCWIVPVVRHWEVTQDQVDGKAPLNWKGAPETSDEVPTSSKRENKSVELPFIPDKVEDKAAKPVENKKVEKPKCFGMANFFDDGSPDPETGEVDLSCKEDCPFFKQCGKEVMKK